MSITSPPFVPEEYQAGAQSWASRAIRDLARALHPILAEVRGEPASDLPRPTESGGGAGLSSPLYRSIDVQYQFSVNIVEVLEFDVDAFLGTLYSVADEFGGQLVRGMFQHISEVSEDNGQVISVGDRSMFDAFADALETMNVEFDEEGNHGLILALHPDVARKLREIGPTPEQEERVNQILKRKREEWRDSRRRSEIP